MEELIKGLFGAELDDKEKNLKLPCCILTLEAGPGALPALAQPLFTPPGAGGQRGELIAGSRRGCQREPSSERGPFWGTGMCQASLPAAAIGDRDSKTLGTGQEPRGLWGQERSRAADHNPCRTPFPVPNG